MTRDIRQSSHGRQCVGYRVGLLIMISATKRATCSIFLFCWAITRLYYENPIRVSPNYFEGSTGLARSGAGFLLKFCCQIKIIFFFGGGGGVFTERIAGSLGPFWERGNPEHPSTPPPP